MIINPVNHNPENDFDPFAGPEIEFYVPSTESQLEIWLSCKLGGEDANRAFNESLSIQLRGAFKKDYFEQALLQLCQRHESLRSAFSEDGTQMVVFREAQLMFFYEDISGIDEASRDKKINGNVEDDALFVFNLTQGPLCRFSLLRLSDTAYHFTLTAHHIICDGWSMGVILQDLSRIYSALVKNEIPKLEPADSFVKYAIEQVEFVKSETYKNNVIYWVNKFKTVPVLDLPIDHPRVNPRTFNASRYDYLLSNELVTAVKQIGVKHGCSFVNTLLTAFEIFISGVSGQDEIVVGLPAADQSATGNYNLVGHCVNLLPIKSVVNTELSFIEYLKERKSAILDAYDHQQFTFGSLLKTLKIKRDPSRVPLVPVVFNIDMEMDSGVDFYGIEYNIISNPKQFRNFELSLNLWGSEKDMQLEWSYNSDIFNRSTIVKMMEEFEHLLRLISEEPSRKIEFLINRKTSAKIHRTLTSQEHNALHQQYWLNNLKDDVVRAEFPKDKIISKGNISHPKKTEIDFGPSVSESLTRYLSEKHLTMQEAMLTLLNILIYRYTGHSDFVLAAFLNTKEKKGKSFPLRIRMNPSKSFAQLARETDALIKEAENNADFSIYELTDELRLNAERLFFNIFFSFSNAAGSFQDEFYNETESDVKLNFSETDNGLKLIIEFEGNSYFDESIRRIALHLQGLLTAILNQPDLPADHLNYMDDGEREQVLQGFNSNKCVYPEGKTIIGLFEEQVALTPDQIALVCEEKHYTYRELNEKTNRLGDFLRKKYKVLPNDLIGIKLERNEWMVIAILGILKSGAAYLPLDPKYPSDRINYILKDSDCKFMIDQTFIQNYLIESANFSRNNPVGCNQPGDLVYVIYTSGSTGAPKGVMVENASLVNYIYSIDREYGMTAADRVIHISNIVFDASAEQLFLALLKGSSLYVYGNMFKEGETELSEYIESNGITHLHSVPTLLQQIDFSAITSLKRVISAGEVCPLNLSDRLGDKIIFFNKYGPTEATISSSIHRVDRKSAIAYVIPIGKPLSNIEIYILDSNQLIVPIGIQGEICIGGKGLARGYLNNPDLTNEKFVENPFKKGEKIYKTGDTGRWLSDGSIEYMGRMDFQVKIRGYRIELGEIESVINEFPFIKNSVVLVKEELNGNQNLVAFVQSNQVVDFKELRSHLNEKLPNYMIPSYFLQIDEMPLTSSGKTDRNNLKNRIIHTNLELNPLDMPTSPEEKLVAKIWSDLLGIEHINKSDNFFELGGHSLIAIKVIIRLENETGFKLPMSSLFEYPTIEKIAKLITSSEELNKWKALVPIKPTGGKIPLYLIHGGGLGVLVFNNIANHFDEDQPVYGLQALGMDGKEEPLASVEEMAAYYISEILEQNANGPYAIAGHSAGGIIAFEMAKQLTRMDKKVNYLAVFDYDYIEIERQKSLKRKIKRKTIDFFPELIFTIKSLIKRPKKTLKHQIMIWHLRYITMLKRLGFEKKVELEGLYLHINKAKTKFEESLKKYKMEPYDGIIDLFISEDKVYYQDDPQYLGWRPFTKKHININKVKGDHDKMILPPNDKAFAKILQKRLDSCNIQN